MYTLIRDPDGKVTLRTHIDPALLPADEARRLLRGLAPLISLLRARSRAATEIEEPAVCGAPRDASGTVPEIERELVAAG